MHPSFCPLPREGEDYGPRHFRAWRRMTADLFEWFAGQVRAARGGEPSALSQWLDSVEKPLESWRECASHRFPCDWRETQIWLWTARRLSTHRRRSRISDGCPDVARRTDTADYVEALARIFVGEAPIHRVEVPVCLVRFDSGVVAMLDVELRPAAAGGPGGLFRHPADRFCREELTDPGEDFEASLQTAWDAAMDAEKSAGGKTAPCVCLWSLRETAEAPARGAPFRNRDETVSGRSATGAALRAFMHLLRREHPDPGVFVLADVERTPAGAWALARVAFDDLGAKTTAACAQAEILGAVVPAFVVPSSGADAREVERHLPRDGMRRVFQATDPGSLYAVRSPLAEALLDYCRELWDAPLPWKRSVDGEFVLLREVAVEASMVRTVETVRTADGEADRAEGESTEAAAAVSGEPEDQHDERRPAKKTEPVRVTERKPAVWREEFESVHRATVTGEAGSGKSSLLQWTGILLAEQAANRIRERSGDLGVIKFPLLVSLPSLLRNRLPELWIEEVVNDRLKKPMVARYLCARIRRGQLFVSTDDCAETNLPVLLLDGADEDLSRGDTREWMAGLFAKLRSYAGSVIVTHRLGADPGLTELMCPAHAKIERYELTNLTPAHLEQLADRWLREEEPRRAFGELLQRNPFLVDLLCRAPLLATLGTLSLGSHRGEGLREWRAGDLFEHLCQHLARRQCPGDPLSPADPAVSGMLAYLPEFAWRLFQTFPAGNEFTGEEILLALDGSGALTRGLPQNFDGQQRCLGDLRRAGFLVPCVETGAHRTFRFPHRALLDFLAARHLAARLGVGGWEEVEVVYAADPSSGSEHFPLRRLEEIVNDAPRVRLARLLDAKSWSPAWRQCLLFFAGRIDRESSLLTWLETLSADTDLPRWKSSARWDAPAKTSAYIFHLLKHGLRAPDIRTSREFAAGNDFLLHRLALATASFSEITLRTTVLEAVRDRLATITVACWLEDADFWKHLTDQLIYLRCAGARLLFHAATPVSIEDFAMNLRRREAQKLFGMGLWYRPHKSHLDQDDLKPVLAFVAVAGMSHRLFQWLLAVLGFGGESELHPLEFSRCLKEIAAVLAPHVSTYVTEQMAVDLFEWGVSHPSNSSVEYEGRPLFRWPHLTLSPGFARRLVKCALQMQDLTASRIARNILLAAKAEIFTEIMPEEIDLAMETVPASGMATWCCRLHDMAERFQPVIEARYLPAIYDAWESEDFYLGRCRIMDIIQLVDMRGTSRHRVPDRIFQRLWSDFNDGELVRIFDIEGALAVAGRAQDADAVPTELSWVRCMAHWLIHGGAKCGALVPALLKLRDARGTARLSETLASGAAATRDATPPACRQLAVELIEHFLAAPAPSTAGWEQDRAALELLLGDAEGFDAKASPDEVPMESLTEIAFDPAVDPARRKEAAARLDGKDLPVDLRYALACIRRLPEASEEVRRVVTEQFDQLPLAAREPFMTRTMFSLWPADLETQSDLFGEILGWLRLGCEFGSATRARWIWLAVYRRFVAGAGGIDSHELKKSEFKNVLAMAARRFSIAEARIHWLPRLRVRMWPTVRKILLRRGNLRKCLRDDPMPSRKYLWRAIRAWSGVASSADVSALIYEFYWLERRGFVRGAVASRCLLVAGICEVISTHASFFALDSVMTVVWTMLIFGSVKVWQRARGEIQYALPILVGSLQREPRPVDWLEQVLDDPRPRLVENVVASIADLPRACVTVATLAKLHDFTRRRWVFARGKPVRRNPRLQLKAALALQKLGEPISDEIRPGLVANGVLAGMTMTEAVPLLKEAKNSFRCWRALPTRLFKREISDWGAHWSSNGHGPEELWLEGATQGLRVWRLSRNWLGQSRCKITDVEKLSMVRDVH